MLAGFTFNQDEKKVSDPRMDEFLERAGVRLLRDEGVLIDNSFYVYGRPDYVRPGRGIEARNTAREIVDLINDDLNSTDPLDKDYSWITGQTDIPPVIDYPVIVLDHEPKELEELSKAGVDLVLSGHTHDGQIFPANILLKFISENSYGYKKVGNMDDIVTSGVGLFGPYMRVGTISEVCNIKVKFTE